MRDKMNAFLRRYSLRMLCVLGVAVACVGTAWAFGPNSNYIFVFNWLVVGWILYYIWKMASTKKYKKYTGRILALFAVLIAANRLYSYKNIIEFFPELATMQKSTFTLIVIVAVILVFLGGYIINYINTEPDILQQEKVEKNSKEKGEKGDRSFSGTNIRTRTMKGSISETGVLKGIGVLAIIGVICWVYFRWDLLGIISGNPIAGLSTFVSTLIGHSVAILCIVFSFVSIAVIFVELGRLLWQRMILFKQRGDAESHEGNATLAFSFSILLAVAVLFGVCKIGNITMDKVTDALVAKDYLALPLIFLLGIVGSVLILRMTYGILSLVLKPTPFPTAEDVKRFVEKINLKAIVSNVAESIVHITIGSIQSVLKFVEFVPDFFEETSEMVLSEECKDKKVKNNHERGIRIIKVAAFGFALVSFIATANGLVNYVFTEPGQKYQAYLISFAIQSILFVFNLKLPEYFARIGELTRGKNAKRRKNGSYKWTTIQGVVAIFYTIVIFSSSCFSYVYIANAVYAKTRYDDSNIILDRQYRICHDEIERYTKEATELSKLIMVNQLTELKELVKENNSTPQSEKNDLEKEKNSARNDWKQAKIERNQVEKKVERLREDLQEILQIHGEESEEYRQKQQDYEEAQDELQVKRSEASKKRLAYENLMVDYTYYRESAATIIQNFLVEILAEESNTEDVRQKLSTYMEQLGGYIIEIDESTDISKDFSQSATKFSELQLSVDDYIELENIRTSMKEYEEEITVPQYGSDNYEVQIIMWEDTWKTRMQSLTESLKKMPDYSRRDENERENYSTSVNFDILDEFDTQDMVEKIDNTVRRNSSTINAIERAFGLLFSKYPALAWFSLVLALFLDVASLLAGLFIYYVTKNSFETVECKSTSDNNFIKEK